MLSEFRQRLVAGSAEQMLLDTLLERCAERKLLGGITKQRTDSTHVVAAIRSLTLLELVGETMRRVLNAIAQMAPEWLEAHLQPEWVKRYGRRFESYRLPKTKEKRMELSESIGRDGYVLLQAIHDDPAPLAVRELPLVETMRRIWVQQYYRCEGTVHWRTKKEWGQPPAHLMLASPNDRDAKYCVKRSTEWTGYKVHLTETCASEHPHLITQVETTVATTHDVKMTETIQDDLVDRELVPEIQLVDMGYMEADLLVSSQDQGIDLVGPVPSSKSWQDKDEEAFDHTQFVIDWEKRVATCPGGKTSERCSDRSTRRETPNVLFTFRPSDCQACDLRPRCTRAKNVGRSLTVYPQRQYEALLQARERQETEPFKKVYGQRAGIEGTISQATRSMGLRRTRYLGLHKTHLQHVATAAAINIVRIVDWLHGHRPSPTPVQPFVALATQMS